MNGIACCDSRRTVRAALLWSCNHHRIAACFAKRGDRLRETGGIFLPRRHEGTKKSGICLARSPRSSQRGRRFCLPVIPVLHSARILREMGVRLFWIGRFLGSTRVAESTSDSGFRSNEVAASVNDSGFRARVSADSTGDSGFEEKHPVSSEKDAIFHADGLPAVVADYRQAIHATMAAMFPLSRRDCPILAGRQVRHRRTQPPDPPHKRTTAPEGRQIPARQTFFRPCRGVGPFTCGPVVGTTG